jgi:hypothetical protein
MVLNKWILFFFSVKYILPVTASETQNEEKKLNIDIIGSGGFVQYGQLFSGNSSYSYNSNLNGYQLNATVLNSLVDTFIGSPVIGFGINYAKTSGTENAVNIGMNSSINLKLSSVSLLAYGGFKFIPARKWSIYTLGSFGGAISDHLKMNGVFSLGQFSSHIDTDVNVYNHYFFGGNIIGSYELLKNISIGAGFNYNRHNLNYYGKLYGTVGNHVFNTEIPNRKVAFNEYSTSLVVIYSL